MGIVAPPTVLREGGMTPGGPPAPDVWTGRAERRVLGGPGVLWAPVRVVWGPLGVPARTLRVLGSGGLGAAAMLMLGKLLIYKKLASI